jgi:hypothetical protein
MSPVSVRLIVALNELNVFSTAHYTDQNGTAAAVLDREEQHTTYHIWKENQRRFLVVT